MVYIKCKGESRPFWVRDRQCIAAECLAQGESATDERIRGLMRTRCLPWIVKCSNRSAMAEGMPEFIDKLSIYSLTCALRDLNAVVDKGKTLTFDEVYDHLESGDLVEFLQERLGPTLFSLVRPGIDQNKYFIDALKYVVNKGREGRVHGVSRNGIRH